MTNQDFKRMTERFNWLMREDKEPEKEPVSYPPMGEILEKMSKKKQREFGYD